MDEDQEHPLLKGATAGMTTGVGFLMITPMALTFWPAAVGIMVGSTAMGMLGVAQSDPADVRMSPPDQTVIVAATKNVQPDRLFRESMRSGAASRTRDPLPIVPWQQAGGADTAGTDPLAEARTRGLDGVLDFPSTRWASRPGKSGTSSASSFRSACAPWTRATGNCGTNGS